MLSSKYTWEWLEGKIGKDLLPCARYFVQHPGPGVNWDRSWPTKDPLTESSEAFQGLCQHFDEKISGCPAQEAPEHFVFIFIDSLGPTAREILQALTLVAKEEYSNFETARTAIGAAKASVSKKEPPIVSWIANLTKAELHVEKRAWKTLLESGLVTVGPEDQPSIVSPVVVETIYLIAKFIVGK